MVSMPKKDDAPTCRTPRAVTGRGHAPVAFMARGGAHVVTTVAGRGRAPVTVLAREGCTPHKGSALEHGPELPSPRQPARISSRTHRSSRGSAAELP
jgi:hypothetical protein